MSSLRIVSAEPPREPTSEPPRWPLDAVESSWCIDASTPGCSLGAAETSAMLASERRAIHMTRGRERAQLVLAASERPSKGQRRIAALIGVSLGLHLLGFAALAWFGDGLESNIAHRGREPFSNERVIVPIDVAPRETPEPEPSFEAEPPPAPTPTPDARPLVHPHRHADSNPAKPEPVAAQPSSYALHGFQLSSEGTIAAGSGEGDAWGSPSGSGHGSGSGGGGSSNPEPAKPATPSAKGPDVQAKPRGSVVEPDYPPELERRGIEGDVLVLVWLDEHGHVIKAEVVEGSGYESFDHNALMAAQQQAWTPASVGGEAVASKRRYRIRFKLPSR